jgi:bacterioferritin
MVVNPRILGFLGRALSLELSAVQQYMTHAKLAEAWGLLEASGRLRHEVVEELQHAERLTGRMLELGVAPNGSQLRPAAVGRSLKELLLADARMENEIIALYDDAVTYCARVGDRENEAYFMAFLQEEQQHHAELEAWLDELQGTSPLTMRGA